MEARAARQLAVELAAANGWREIREGIEVELARWPETGETAILCRSTDRCGKEQAMRDKFSRRIEAALTKAGTRIEGSTRRFEAARISRILQRNQR